jgi:hypothetical protein
LELEIACAKLDKTRRLLGSLIDVWKYHSMTIFEEQVASIREETLDLEPIS